MKNSNLMQILKQINLSNRYKNLAIGLGVLAFGVIVGGAYHYSKFISANESLKKMKDSYDLLLNDSLADKDIVRQQQEEINRLLS